MCRLANDIPVDSISREDAIASAKPIMTRVWLRRMKEGQIWSIREIPNETGERNLDGRRETGERDWVVEAGGDQIMARLWLERLRTGKIKDVYSIPVDTGEFDWTMRLMSEDTELIGG